MIRRFLVLTATLSLGTLTVSVARPLTQTSPQPPAQGSSLPSARLNRAIELLEQDKPIFGLISADRSLENARAMAASGADFVIIDMEHGTLDFERLQMFLLGMINKAEIAEKGNLQPNVTPMVRVPQYGHESLAYTVKQVLDLGVMGIMFPAISNKQEAINAIAASRYPQPVGSPTYEPIGRRGNGPMTAMWLWGIRDYARRADVWPLAPQGELLLFLQIETWEGVQQIDEILSVPGVGGIFLGPSDLRYSLASQPNTPDVDTAIQTVVTACRERGIPIGITASAADAEQRLNQGFRILTLGGYGEGVSAAAAEGISTARAAVQ